MIVGNWRWEIGSGSSEVAKAVSDEWEEVTSGKRKWEIGDGKWEVRNWK